MGLDTAENGCVTGDVATDGSLIGSWAHLGRTGWAVAECADEPDDGEAAPT